MRLKIELYEPVGGAGLTTTFIVEECDQWEVLDSGCLSLIEPFAPTKKLHSNPVLVTPKMIGYNLPGHWTNQNVIKPAA